MEGEIVAYDAAAAELRPFGEVMFRRRKHGITGVRARGEHAAHPYRSDQLQPVRNRRLRLRRH